MGGVRFRTVFYVAGFDARGVRHYHPLFVDQAARQQAIAGPEIRVGEPEEIGPHLIRWRLTRGDVATDYVFANWGDIVRPFFNTGPFAMWRGIVASTARLLATGVLARTFAWSWTAGVTASLSAVVLVLFPLVALALLVAALVAPWAFSIVLVLLAAAIGLVAVRWMKRFQVPWLARAIPFFTRDEEGTIPGLDDRIDRFADVLAAAIDDPANDEVLLVGHSYGTPVAVKIAAAALARSSGRLSLLTLGQIIPLLAWLPGAAAMRDALRTVGHSPRIDWVDVSSPPDGACYAFVDPLTALGENLGGRTNPKMVNASFHRTMAPDRYARAQRNWQALHFQYILASLDPDAYDYFAIVAGDASLADRFAARASVRDFTRLRGRSTKAIR